METLIKVTKIHFIYNFRSDENCLQLYRFAKNDTRTLVFITRRN